MREKLKKVRLNQDLTQEKIAKMVGISRVHYTQIENASNNKCPSLDVAINIKKALNYQGDDLFLISDVPNENK